jgi:hypothetical protein
MAESSSVRLLQHHLRQAGALIASRQLDAASTHIDAALAIDPASLAALTLRDRLLTIRGQSRQATAPSAIDPKSDATTRFIPSGVNADSWLDFEQRIQARRFRALIETAERAVAAGDGAAARSAIDEARELCPDAGEITRLSSRITLLQVPAGVATGEWFFRSRTFRAVSLLLLGVTLLMGLDWVRSGPASPASVNARAESESAPVLNTALTSDNRSENAVTANAEGTSGTTPERLPLTYRSLSAASTSVPLVVAPAPVSERLSAPAETAVQSPLPSAGLAGGAVSTPPIVRGEVPDDYVAPRRDTSREVAPPLNRPIAQTAPLTSVVRQPTSVESFGPASAAGGPTPTSTASASAPAAPLPAAFTPSPGLAPVNAPTSMSDNSRVNAVLNQYASAYGQLNASAVRSIWPSVDERALAKAFSNLSSQSMAFDNCDIVVNGGTARASCRGRASYVVKVGSQERHNETRTVRFELKRDGEAWKILKAETTR